MTKAICTALLILLFGKTLIAQTYQVSGKIIDSKSNKGLEFATVRVLGTDNGTTADGDGNYVMQLQQGGHELIVSYIGYNTDTASIFVYAGSVSRDIVISPSGSLTEATVVSG